MFGAADATFGWSCLRTFGGGEGYHQYLRICTFSEGGKNAHYVYVRERAYKHTLSEPTRLGWTGGDPPGAQRCPWARKPFPLPCRPSLLSQPASQATAGRPACLPPLTHPSPPHRPTRPGRAETSPWAVPRKWRRRARCPCRPIAAPRWACRPSPVAGCPTWWGPGPAGGEGKSLRRTLTRRFSWRPGPPPPSFPFNGTSSNSDYHRGAAAIL